ncbi:ClpXP protease specificity-enhancing factor [Alteromonadaceae bacterium BrNp21-10]|nr:ClpXP protease specificity-enhancing factor [Alteromonadaceae bacterium BrNp21-10]
MTSNRPYLLRAFYEWLVDNDLTPYIVVDATFIGVQVPQEHVKQGQIVLNVAPSACQNLLLGDFEVTFNARFGGSARQLVVPVNALLAIYAKENGAGTIFTHDEDELDDEPLQQATTDVATDNKPPVKGKPSLTVVK